MKPIEIPAIRPCRAPVSNCPIVRSTFDADPDTCGQGAVPHMTLPADGMSMPEHHHGSSQVALVALNGQLNGPIAAPFQQTVEEAAPLCLVSRWFARVDIGVHAALKSSVG